MRHSTAKRTITAPFFGGRIRGRRGGMVCGGRRPRLPCVRQPLRQRLFARLLPAARVGHIDRLGVRYASLHSQRRSGQVVEKAIGKRAETAKGARTRGVNRGDGEPKLFGRLSSGGPFERDAAEGPPGGRLELEFDQVEQMRPISVRSDLRPQMRDCTPAAAAQDRARPIQSALAVSLAGLARLGSCSSSGSCSFPHRSRWFTEKWTCRPPGLAPDRRRAAQRQREAPRNRGILSGYP